MINTCSFPFKAWMTSVFIGPFLLIFKSTVSEVIGYIFSLDFALFYPMAVLVGWVFSVPCFLFLWLCYALLLKTNQPIWFIKGVLISVSFLCCITVFIFMSLPDLRNFWSRGNIILISAYALPLIVGILCYKIKEIQGRKI